MPNPDLRNAAINDAFRNKKMKKGFEDAIISDTSIMPFPQPERPDASVKIKTEDSKPREEAKQPLRIIRGEPLLDPKSPVRKSIDQAQDDALAQVRDRIALGIAQPGEWDENYNALHSPDEIITTENMQMAPPEAWDNDTSPFVKAELAAMSNESSVNKVKKEMPTKKTSKEGLRPWELSDRDKAPPGVQEWNRPEPRITTGEERKKEVEAHKAEQRIKAQMKAEQEERQRKAELAAKELGIPDESDVTNDLAPLTAKDLLAEDQPEERIGQ